MILEGPDVPEDFKVELGEQMLKFRDMLLEAPEGEVRASVFHEGLEHFMEEERKEELADRMEEGSDEPPIQISCKKGKLILNSIFSTS